MLVKTLTANQKRFYRDDNLIIPLISLAQNKIYILYYINSPVEPPKFIKEVKKLSSPVLLFCSSNKNYSLTAMQHRCDLYMAQLYKNNSITEKENANVINYYLNCTEERNLEPCKHL